MNHQDTKAPSPVADRSPADAFGVTMDSVFERLRGDKRWETFVFNRCQCCGGWIGNEALVHRKVSLGWGFWHRRCVPPLTLAYFRLRCALGIERRPTGETWPERLAYGLQSWLLRFRRALRGRP